MKTGLVLEGGAMRGLFTAGVLDVLMEKNVAFDGIAGVSAGAAFGCNWKSHQSGRVLRYNLKYCRDRRYCSFWSWLSTGNLFGADFCYRKLPDELDPFDAARFEADPAEFILVCTDIGRGEAVYRKCVKADRECYEWMRASASMPLVSRIVRIGGGEYLDGALTDSIPLEFMERRGYGRNVVILTQPAGYVKQPVRLLPLLEIVYRKYPKMLEALKKRHLRYNAEVAFAEAREAAGAALIVRPEQPLPVGRLSRSPEKLRRTYEIGRAAAEKCWRNIAEFTGASPGR